MASYTQTAKYLLRRLTGSSNVSDIDDGIGALADDVDANMAGYAEGTLAGRPSAGKAGRLYRTTDTVQVFMDAGAGWIEIGVAPWMPGDLKASWLTAAPAGWLLCDGAAVSRATYAGLYAAIGTSAGAGNGTTTFNVPDYRGRVFVMPDGTAGRMASGDSRGLSGGAETVTLDASQLPALTVSAPYTTAAGGVTSGAGIPPHNSNPSGGNWSGTVNGTGGLPHGNMPPYLVGGAVLIKT